MSDPVKAPRHYRGDGEVECKRAMRSMTTDVKIDAYAAHWWQEAFKYVWRWPIKNGVQDIDKAIESLTELKRTMTE